jgi:hypothetical protein
MMKSWEEVHNVEKLGLYRPLLPAIVRQDCELEKNFLRAQKNSFPQGWEGKRRGWKTE